MNWFGRPAPTTPIDGLREFIYLDETRVVSLLAAIQGAIPETVTDSAGRTRTRGLSLKSGLAGVADAEASLGSSSSSGTETLRRAVAQSTFRELWRRDTGVLLHDPISFSADLGQPIRDAAELSSRIEALVASRAATPVSDLTRGSVIEVGWEVRPDEAHQTLIAARAMFDLVSGRESLFGLQSSDLATYGPIFEVLAEFSVGLMPIRGLCTTHQLYEVEGEVYLVNGTALDPAGSLLSEAHDLEMVAFTEADSYWRDPRSTLMAGFGCKAYLRLSHESFLDEPWNPFKLADVLGALGPNMRGEAIQALEFLRQPDAASAPPTNPIDPMTVIREFAALVGHEVGADIENAAVGAVLESAAGEMAAATTIPEERLAFERVVEVLDPDGTVDREVIRQLRARATNNGSPEATTTSAETTRTAPEPTARTPQLEVSVIALYW